VNNTFDPSGDLLVRLPDQPEPVFLVLQGEDEERLAVPGPVEHPHPGRQLNCLLLAGLGIDQDVLQRPVGRRLVGHKHFLPVRSPA
jgi:hypothetical protein